MCMNTHTHISMPTHTHVLKKKEAERIWPIHMDSRAFAHMHEHTQAPSASLFSANYCREDGSCCKIQAEKCNIQEPLA